MLRFILVRETMYECNGMRNTEHYTIDVAVPELEEELTGGGSGESGYDIRHVVAVEVIPNAR